MNAWQSETLSKAYYALGEERANLAQPNGSPIDDTLRQAMDLIEEADELLTEASA